MKAAVLAATAVTALAVAPAALGGYRGGERDVSSLTVAVPAHVHHGQTYRVRVNAPASSLTFVAIQFRSDGCAGSAQSQDRRAHITQWLTTNHRGSYTGRFVAGRVGSRRLCSWTYLHRISSQSRARPLARVGVPYTVVGGAAADAHAASRVSLAEGVGVDAQRAELVRLLAICVHRRPEPYWHWPADVLGATTFVDMGGGARALAYVTASRNALEGRVAACIHRGGR